jgi:hypothetical protein
LAYVELETDAQTEPVTFRTDGRWLAKDLTEFLNAVEAVYTTFVVVYRGQEALEQTGRWHQSLGERYSAAGPAIPIREPEAAQYIDFLSERILEIVPEARMVIRQVEMGSPGAISLAGLGEPIQQLREFIKDLWYRNRQEKQAGQLEILRQYLAIEREFGPLPPTVTDRLAPKALRGVQTLATLEDEGKLIEIPASIGG